MAENKKSFILYADLIHTVKKLPKGKQAELFMTILQYVNDENPQVDDLLVSIAFEPVKLQLKRDLKDWEEERKNRSAAGKKGMETRWKGHKKITKDNSVIKPITSITDNVTVTVNDTVTDNVKESNTHALKNSNLFRQPKIPDFEEVHRAFLSHGGTEEMARVFFDKNTATSWFSRGSPITNFASLVPSYVESWKENLKKNGKTSIVDKQKSARADLRARGQDSFNAALREADN